MGNIEIVLRITEIITQCFVGLMIFLATMKAPSHAVQNQKNREKDEKARNRKLDIFYTLMQTRRQRLSYRHIEALNMIDIEYNGVNDITDAWSEYLDHLNNYKTEDSSQWEKEGNKLFINMLYQMSSFLGYNYTRLNIENKFYSPQAHHDQDLDRRETEKYLADILSHRKAFPIVIKQEQN